MIVKVQLSLSTTAGKRQMLIYNEDRSVQYESDATKDVLKKMGRLNKAYFKAVIRSNGILVLLDREEDQDW